MFHLKCQQLSSSGLGPRSGPGQVGPRFKNSDQILDHIFDHFPLSLIGFELDWDWDLA